LGKGDYLGAFEAQVMLAVSRLGAGAYGMTIRRLIHERTGRDASIGSVYATLERLEQKGLVRSYQGEATEVRGGRAKRYFELTSGGLRALSVSDDAYMKMRSGARWRPAWGRS
jgi:DNA-binding PadR family transcriptional regulator